MILTVEKAKTSNMYRKSLALNIKIKKDLLLQHIFFCQINLNNSFS